MLKMDRNGRETEGQDLERLLPSRLSCFPAQEHLLLCEQCSLSCPGVEVFPASEEQDVWFGCWTS